MRRVKQVITVLVVLFVLGFIGLSIAVATIDPDKYRPQIVDALSKKTGRTIKLNGPIKLGISLHGITVSVRDASIGNPSWASRPDMAGIGTFELGVALLPLLNKDISVTQLKITNADILLETGAGGKHNWDMAGTEQPGKAATKSAAAPSGHAASIQVDNVSIKDSQLAVRDEDGKKTVFKVKDMKFGLESSGIGLHFTGELNSAPLTADVSTGAREFMATNEWPVDAHIMYAGYHLMVKGKVNAGAKKADIASYSVSAGKSELHGQMAANWGGAKPSVKGTLNGEQFNPADFQPAATKNPTAAKEEKQAPGPKRMFSEVPLALDSLKSANADIDVSLAEVTVGNDTLKNVTGKLDLNNGNLSLPVKATLGKNAMNADIKLNAAASPAQFSMTFSAPNSDLADLLKLGGGKAFLSGTANTDMTVTSSGNSMHQLAGNANGKLDVIADGGEVSASEASGISSGLARIFAPNGTNALNCLAARFVITNGVVKDNGLLVDTTATTILGKGGANLGTEVIDMSLRAKTKLVNLGGLLPPLHIGGTLSNPGYSMDPTAVAQNVVGILTSGSLDGNSGVPDLQKVSGQNACVYTLDHPVAAKPSVVQSTTNKAGQKAQDIGNAIKGLFGK